jgi:hypothetical protein
VPDEGAEEAVGRHGDALLRVFCHVYAYGEKIVLPLTGYDRG